MLVTGGMNDPRVLVFRADEVGAKAAASHLDNKERVLLKMQAGSGHHGPSGRYQAWRDWAFRAGFRSGGPSEQQVCSNPAADDSSARGRRELDAVGLRDPAGKLRHQPVHGESRCERGAERDDERARSFVGRRRPGGSASFAKSHGPALVCSIPTQQLPPVRLEGQ